MDNTKKKGLAEKLRAFIKENKLSFKLVETPEEEPRNEVFVKLEAFARDQNPKVEKFVDVTLADGTMAVIEPAVEVGAAFVLMDEDGNPVPAPAGAYELEDGRVINVAEGEDNAGIIESITEAEVEESPEVEEEMAEVEEKELTEDEELEAQNVKRVIETIIKEKIFVKAEDHNKVVDELKTAEKDNKFLMDESVDMTERYNEMVTKFTALQEFTGEIISELLDEPAQKPVVANKHPLHKDPKTNIFHNN